MADPLIDSGQLPMPAQLPPALMGLQQGLAQPQTNPLLAGLGGQAGQLINSSAVPSQAPPPVNLGTTDTQEQSQQQPQPSSQGPPKPSYVPALIQIAHQLFGKGLQGIQVPGGTGQVPTNASGQVAMDQQPQMPMRPASRLDAFEGFLGQFLNSLSQGMSNAGTGPAANARGFGAAMQAPYQRELQQYQLNQQYQQQQASLAEAQARTQGQTLENELTQRRLSMMGQALASGQDPVGSLGTLSSDEQAQVAAAKQEAGLKGDMTPLLQVVDKITNNRAVAHRQEVGITAANQRASQALGEKMREFKITDAYRKWKENLDIQTKNRIADLAQNKAPAAMQEAAVFAKSGLNRLDDARQAMDELQASGVMGSLPANKVEDWIFGNGLVDPTLDAKTRATIGKLRSALSYTSTAAMRAHTGRTSQEIFDDFKKTLGPGQDWDALSGAMDETRSMLTEYATAPSDENIRRMRAGQMLATGGGQGGGKKNGAVPTIHFTPSK